MRKLTVRHESWPIAGSFTISRGSKTSAEVVVVTTPQEAAAMGSSRMASQARPRRESSTRVMTRKTSATMTMAR